LWLAKGAQPCCGPSFFANALLGGWDEDLVEGHELEVGGFGVDADGLELAFLAAVAAAEREQVLIAEVLADFVEVGLEVDGSTEAEIVGFGAGLLGELAEERLRVIDAEEAAAAVEIIRRVNGPNVDVLFFSSGDGGIDVGIL
jgi:hypothetical protein